MGKKVIKLTESELKEMIVDAVKQVLNEGIKVRYGKDKDFVTFDDSKDGLLDEIVKDKFKLPNSELVIDIYSMFKRVNGVGGRDANPLLFALKDDAEKSRWVLENPDAFWRRFSELVEMFLQDHPLDKVVVLPSTHGVNEKFAQKISQLSPNTKIYDGFLAKKTVSEIKAMAYEPTSFFRKYWWERGGEDGVKEAYSKLEQYLSAMKNGIFSYTDIPDMEFRKSLTNTLKLTDQGRTYCNEINGKDILLLDDSIAAGQTVESAINALKTCYEPKSISLITIFSKKYPK